MAGVSADGLDEAVQQLQAHAERLRDFSRPLAVYARFVEKEVDDCFDQSRDWDGTPFAPLAESTIAQRISNLKAANKRTKSGELTKASKGLRDQLRAPGGIKPLVDTARARNSQHSDVEPDAVVWSAVGYLGYHFTGNEHLPERNPSPFVFSGSDWSLHPRAASMLAELIGSHVMTGEAAE